MNEFKIHKLLCELIEAWESNVSPEECLENVLRYNTDLAGRKRGVSEMAIKQVLQHNKCANPEKFLHKYEHLKAKKLDILGPFMNLLMQLKDDTKLVEIIKRKHQKDNKELNFNPLQLKSQTALNFKDEDAQQVCSKLVKMAAKLQVRKSAKSESRGGPPMPAHSDITDWSSGAALHVHGLLRSAQQPVGRAAM
ncbi:uncharacterized protein LOC120355771 isoform X2 [Nilaparvata lugens]|uniref:uncharacterized protein LOC120355771 isoform X2 n=1 Tax=Nilaparvata lugens TaxID=108931 RepID=UPI00193E198B|nr:uncharacterized protein LOC120355771 isoform X2 [Nilaparvata lugens]